jgi:TPP-dependent pyruvate/acetoin dehydrogenase alpha subunit
MYAVRILEDRLQELCLQGFGADLHFSKGQEAVPVGVMAALRETDYVVTHHRSIAHALVKGVPLGPLVAEILGKASGINGGMAGEMALHYPQKRFMSSFQLVGTCVPVAAGIAWALRHVQRTDDVVVVFFGDAATANGQWHEGVNLATTKRAPLLLVCENNRLAGNVRPEHYQPEGGLRQRSYGYGIPSASVNGNNVGEVTSAARSAIDMVRNGSYPYFLECVTTRLGRHKQGQGDLRTKEEIEMLTQYDPLKDAGISDDRKQEIAAFVEATVVGVLAQPDASYN